MAGAALELSGAHRRGDAAWACSASRTGTGRAGRLLRAGRALTAVGVAGALLGRRSRVVSALSGVALLAASLATRFGIFEGGVASAKDPKYTVEPQRERLAPPASDPSANRAQRASQSSADRPGLATGGLSGPPG